MRPLRNTLKITITTWEDTHVLEYPGSSAQIPGTKERHAFVEKLYLIWLSLTLYYCANSFPGGSKYFHKNTQHYCAIIVIIKCQTAKALMFFPQICKI